MKVVTPQEILGSRNPSAARSKKAFSLVEVVIALGVVAFAFIGIIGSLPVGIQSMQDAMQQQAKANITQQLRSDLQQIPFAASSTSSSSDYTIESLAGVTWWYTSEGMKTDKRDEAFYEATFELDTASVISEQGGEAVTFTPASARNVRATLSYPLDAPVENRKETTITLFSAKQKNA